MNKDGFLKLSQMLFCVLGFVNEVISHERECCFIEYQLVYSAIANRSHANIQYNSATLSVTQNEREPSEETIDCKWLKCNYKTD